ncbi:hypothetical protein FOC1_g10001995 [Fusarium oxysporum f. sp. cubense race 1]|uniref:Uncharacterized protein n=1 Tax=Fusarium oxysporum f. sp. cubense (strain race 1) TaxID=1229664 RepID=N4V488_FUSC1|nr:hypothetical protein FOC1_g10001995 [Fusarium oxysporum f. sp. cubense race 1]
MAVDEKWEAIDQIDIDIQVVAESSTNGCQKEWARSKARRCGTYRKTGHSARRCRIVIHISAEQDGN